MSLTDYVFESQMQVLKQIRLVSLDAPSYFFFGVGFFAVGLAGAAFLAGAFGFAGAAFLAGAFGLAGEAFFTAVFAEAFLGAVATALLPSLAKSLALASRRFFCSLGSGTGTAASKVLV